MTEPHATYDISILYLDGTRSRWEGIEEFSVDMNKDILMWKNNRELFVAISAATIKYVTVNKKRVKHA